MDNQRNADAMCPECWGKTGFYKSTVPYSEGANSFVDCHFCNGQGTVAISKGQEEVRSYAKDLVAQQKLEAYHLWQIRSLTESGSPIFTTIYFLLAVLPFLFVFLGIVTPSYSTAVFIISCWILSYFSYKKGVALERAWVQNNPPPSMYPTPEEYEPATAIHLKKYEQACKSFESYRLEKNRVLQDWRDRGSLVHEPYPKKPQPKDLDWKKIDFPKDFKIQS